MNGPSPPERTRRQDNLAPRVAPNDQALDRLRPERARDVFPLPVEQNCLGSRAFGGRCADHGGSIPTGRRYRSL